MDYTRLKQATKGIPSKDLDQRKSWYSPAAEAYNIARPKFPSGLVKKAVNTAQLR
jgi:hypothetical protein